MASSMTCDMCHEQPAELLIGEIETGDQTAVCAACTVAWAVARLSATLSADAYAALGAAMVESVMPPQEEAPRPKRGGKRARQDEEAPAAEPQHAAAEAAPQATDPDG